MLLLVTILLAAPPEVLLDQPIPVLQTDVRFRQELERPISASWGGAELRSLLRRITADRQVAILLDRRIDPNQELTLDVQDRTLRDALAEIASHCGAEMSVAGNVVYLGPSASAAKLRTLIELRSSELHRSSSGIAKSRQVDLAARKTIHWNDLDRPADVLRQISERFKVKILNSEAVPHDLWAGATLPNVTAAEALSLVLIQFDLTFEWTDAATAVRLVPMPQQVAVEKHYTPRNRSLADTLKDWQEQFPELQADIRGKELVVMATVEQHEALAESLKPTARRPSTRTTTNAPVPLRRREFTLRIERVPVSALMKKLEMSDVIFQYDPAQLTAAGIDLDQPISLDVTKAPAEKFFAAMFEPLGLAFQIDNVTVTLRPK